MAQQQAASNAAFTLDGLPFVRTSNLVSDALPGVTLALKAKGGAAETLTLDTDAEATQAKLQAFADAYNGVLSLVQKNLNVTQSTDRARTLAGDSTLRFLQTRLQSVISSQVAGMGTVRTLADLGFRTAKDGSLSIDKTVLEAAVARDPGAVDGLFSTATSGIKDVVSTLVQGYVKPVDGLLSARSDGLTQSIRSMVDDQARWEARIAAYKEGLTAQFTAMENVVSKLKNLGTFLTNAANQSSSSK
jgi:flagellar hook-associated protein 2